MTCPRCQTPKGSKEYCPKCQYTYPRKVYKNKATARKVCGDKPYPTKALCSKHLAEDLKSRRVLAGKCPTRKSRSGFIHGSVAIYSVTKFGKSASYD